MQLEKREVFSNDIIFIDGLWGSGKSLLAPIVSAMNGVEKVKIEGIYEYVSWLYYLKKIDEDAALWMLRTYADMGQYHNRIGREINLRWSDDTGLKYVQGKFSLIRRLFAGEGDKKAEEISQKNLAYCVMSHMLMLAPDLLLKAYGDRVKIVEVVRHPLYMVGHFSAYLSRFDSQREFTTSFYFNNHKLPWFVEGWANEFIAANPTERAILCVNRLYTWLYEKIDEARQEGLEILVVSFEESVFQTNLILEKLQDFVGRAHHADLDKILKIQKLPRSSIYNGRGHAGYGWSESNKPDKETYKYMTINIRKNCSDSIYAELEKTIAWYNENFPSELVKFK